MQCNDAIAAVIDELVQQEPLPLAAHAHLEGCAGCQAEAEQLRGLWQDLRPAVATTAQPDTVERFLARAHVELRKRVKGERMRARAGIAAVIALATLTGGAAGYMMRGAPSVDTEGSQFLLLLHGSPAGAPAELDPAALVAEYRAWAQQLAGEGRLVTAEKLADDGGRWLGVQPDVAPEELVSGYFLIRADRYEEALRVAQASPHVRYGGTVQVRRIERTAPPPRSY